MNRPQPTAWFFCDPPYVGGAEQYVQWHLQAAGPQRAGLVVIELPTLQDWIAQVEGEGFAVERIPTGSLRQRIAATWRRLRSLRPDVVHVNFPHPYDGLMGAAPMVAKRAGARRVLVTEHIPSFGRIGKRYWFKRAWVPAVDCAITVCEAHRRDLIQTFHYASDRVRAIPNGVPDSNPDGRIAAVNRADLPPVLGALDDGKGVRLVQVGSLDERKGVDVLLRAIAAAQAGPQFSLWLVGDGPQRRAFEQQAADLGIASRVHFLGHRRDVPAILAACDIAVLASRREGMPFSLLEAMAHGLPGVASAVDGVGEIVLHEDSGLLVPPDDAPALSTAMGRLIADASERGQFGRRARELYLQRHTLEAMTQATFREYGPAFLESSSS